MHKPSTQPPTAADVIEHTLKQTQGTTELFQVLTNETLTAAETMIPIMRAYLADLVGVRMSFGREVQDILRSSRSLGESSKATADLVLLVKALQDLKAILTPEFVEILARITGKD